MNIVLTGPPGAGKGTQAEMITANYKILHISTGDMFRDAVEKGTEMGRKAGEFMQAGQLVPDDVTIGIVAERLAQPDCKQGFLLDGFPRTIKQAEALDDILAGFNQTLHAVINIAVPDEVLLERMTGRLTCSGCKTIYHRKLQPPRVEGVCDKCGSSLQQRGDDTAADTAKNRLAVYKKQTNPLLEYYEKKNLLINVDGQLSPDEVFAQIRQNLEAIQ